MKYITQNDAKEHQAMLDAAERKRADAIAAAQVQYEQRVIEIEMQYGKERYDANRWLEAREFDKV